MEAKRSNLQTLQRSQSSKTQVLKTASEVSLTPSQAAEQAKANARKNPLDALSRLSMRNQAVERRSGLQDVDDEYLKKNIFARSGLPKHSGLNDVYGSRSQIQTQSTLQVSSPQNDVSHIQSPELLQSLSPQISTQSQLQVPAHKPQQQQSQPQVTTQQQFTPAHATQLQSKNSSYKEPHSSQATTAIHHNYHCQQQSQQPVVPANEPELCTTCPNCQTTIYLVRGHEGSGEQASAYLSTNNENGIISVPNN